MCGPPARILVLTADLDPTADLVLQRLLDDQIGFVRLDPVNFPTMLTLGARLTAGQWAGRLSGRRHVDLSAVRAVYYRRPGTPQPAARLGEEQRSWCRRQAEHGLLGVLHALPDVRWINDPRAADAADSKPVHLAVAARCGLAVPPTLVTNDPGQVADFATAAGGRIVVKALDARPPVDDTGRPTGVLYTTEVPPPLWSDPGIGLTAHLFQQLVEPKSHDVRVTAVGDRLFAVAIHTDSKAAALDWRADYSALTYHVCTVPDAVRSGVYELMTHLGLVFAALDFVIGPDGTWWAVDINPSGQWGWLELQTGVPISRALADLLKEQQ